MPPMKIVCARSVLAATEAFSTAGAVSVLPDRHIRREHLLDADALIIRSKTRVDRALLEGTSVAFVGTATAGFDHIDAAACEALGVAWTAAPGCNATSVAEYVAAALLNWAEGCQVELAGRTMAVVGVGQVGRRVVRIAEALGMIVLQNDPPRALVEGDAVLRPLDEILPRADIVTLHVPLTDVGPFATRRMVDCRFLARLPSGALFINASRGEVVDESALMLACQSGHIGGMILDVWDHEPHIDPALLEAARIATPHIAGYSWDGKLAGTAQVYREFCRFFELPERWSPATVEPGEPPPAARISASGRPAQAVLRDMVRAVYDIERDDRALRGEGAPAGETLSEQFERLRKTYPVRREFAASRVELEGANAAVRHAACGLGFALDGFCAEV